jgi:phosphoenolpyruvate carboxykinase (GTP)
VPKDGSLDVSGLNLNEGVMKELLHVDKAGYKKEVEKLKQYQKQFGDKFPQTLKEETKELEKRLS